MMKSSVLAVALSALVLAGCANHRPKVYDYSALKQSDPRSILVVMPTSDSTDIRAESSVLAQATVPLAERGYYVFPVALVDEMFRQNGLTNGHDIQQAPIRKLREIFGADAVMYLHVEEYGARYQVVSSVTTVTVKGRLVDLRNGKTLWEGRASSRSGSDSTDRGGLAALIAAATSQILDTINDSGYEMAGAADALLFSHGDRGGLLYGPYHPEHAAP